MSCVVCCVSCLVCGVSCVVYRVSCVVYRVLCVEFRVAYAYNVLLLWLSPPLPPYNVNFAYFFLQKPCLWTSEFFRTVAKSGVECCWRHSAGVDLFWGTPLEILICPIFGKPTGVAAWTVCKLAQEAEKPCGRY